MFKYKTSESGFQLSVAKPKPLLSVGAIIKHTDNKLTQTRGKNVWEQETVFDILEFSFAVRLGGHKERKVNDHVYSFLLFVSSTPCHQAEFILNLISIVTYSRTVLVILLIRWKEARVFQGNS